MCWTIALLWLVTALFKQPTLGRYFGLALCTHCLLVSAYPQQVVWTGYLLTAYTLVDRRWKGVGPEDLLSWWRDSRRALPSGPVWMVLRPEQRRPIVQRPRPDRRR